MASVPDPVDVQDFKMIQLCRFKVTEKPYDVQYISSLLAISNLFGLVFVGTTDKVIVIKVADLVQIDNASSKKTEVSTFPFKEILLPSSPSFVALSCDNLSLMVCFMKAGCPVSWMYDVRGFAREGGPWNPFQEVRLSPTEGTAVKDCAWNPTLPDLVAVCLSDGSLILVQINNAQFTINSLPANTGAEAISWSPKGKQLVVARPGKLVQYKPDLKEAKTIPFSGEDLQMTKPTVCGLQWLSNVQFLVTFIDESDPNSRPHLYIVNVHKAGKPTYVDYDDVCYGNPSGERSNRYFSLGIPSWNVLLACSANAMEVAVLGQFSGEGTDHPEWRQWTLEGECRAELPLDKNDETKPMGMAVDTTSQSPIPWLDNQTLPSVPILFVLSTHGLLCPFHVLNLMSGAIKVNQPPQELTAANERPPLSGIGLKTLPKAPLAASTPLPAAGKSLIPRTNLGERFAAFSDAPSVASTAVKPMPTNTESFFTKSSVQPPPPPSTVPTKLVAAPASLTAPPVKSIPVEPHGVAPKPSVSPVKLLTTSDETSMGAAAAILRDEVAKFEQELREFKARSSTLRVTVASEEDKQRLLKMTSDLSEFGTVLVGNTKQWDEKVRGLCTDLVEVAALLEDARVRHARRKNSRYSHLLKLRPLDPANRRKLDRIENSHVRLERQLVLVSDKLDDITRDRTRDTKRRVEIPITQMIYESIKMHARTIPQLKSKVERIKAQSKEQQLKLAGAAFEALRPKALDDSRKSESDLAELADSLLIARIRSDGDNQSTHPVIPQVSPEKQAMLRNVLAQRPVARIRAVRPESVAESRLLSNLTGLMQNEEKRDTSLSCSSLASHTPPRIELVASEVKANHSSTPDTKPQLSKMFPSTSGLTSASISTSFPTSNQVSRQSAVPSVASRQSVEVEDITPPSSPMNFEQKAKSIGNQPMISGLSLLTSASVTPSIETTSVTGLKPAVSVPPPSTNLSKPTVSMPEFGTPKTGSSSFGGGSSSLFGKSSFASAFNSTAAPVTTTVATSKPTDAVTKPLFSSLGTSLCSSTPPSTTAALLSSQATSVVNEASSISVKSTETPSTSAKSTETPSTSAKSTEATTLLKPSFSFASLSSAGVGVAPTSAQNSTAFVSTAPTFQTQTVAASPSSFSFISKSLPPSTSAPTTVTSTPLSFVTPNSSLTISTPASTSESKPATIPSASPASFSFSLTNNATSTSTTAAAPFSFSLPSNTSVSTSSVATPSLFGVPATSPPTGPVFSLNSANKAPTAFGVVDSKTGTAVSTSSSSLFGQAPLGSVVSSTTPAIAPLFGQSSSTPVTTTSNTNLTSLFGQSKPNNVVPIPTTETSTPAQVATTTTATPDSSTTPVAAAPTTLFGRPATITGNVGTSLFGQPTNNAVSSFGSSFGQSVFGQPISTAVTSAPATGPVFGQATFGKPAQTTPLGTGAPVTGFGTSAVFGQSSGTSTGLLSGSAFGQPAAPASTPAKPLFGSSSFGQTPASNATPAATSPAPNTGFGSNLFGNMGLGGTPNAANVNRNAFGGGTVFGGATPSASGTFGAISAASPFGAQSSSSVISPPTFGSPPSTGFGAFGQNQPAFGGAATFGGSPIFGSKQPTFGGGATFGSPVAGIGASKPETGFGAFAASNVPTFGVLANSGPSFETLANSGVAPPAFGGAAFPSSNPPSFGGGSSFSSWR